ncbi:MAG: methyltransferase domain-containing protein [Candidatus Electrothrix sp. LOE2]|nr:methyltransferase domain-containing protein [Candidatus Electrothrix sp. LOE2]
MKSIELYGLNDPLGRLLCEWRIRAVLPWIRGSRVIDLACGDNRLIRLLGYGVGVDIQNYGDADLILQDFTSLPFPTHSIDTVSILAALNYFDNPEKVMRELARVLKRDGIIIVTLLRKPISGLWHRFRDTSLPRIAYDENELLRYADGGGLTLCERRVFMLGLNQLFILCKADHQC